MRNGAMTFLLLVVMFGSGCDQLQPANSDSAPTEPAQDEETREAGVGVGKKGRSLEGEKGIGKVIASPAVEYFKTKEKMVFEVQIPQAMNLFRAEHGTFPESHEEFMEKIIEFNRIPLPELPEGRVYFYDPEAGKLMVGPEK